MIFSHPFGGPGGAGLSSIWRKENCPEVGQYALLFGYMGLSISVCLKLTCRPVAEGVRASGGDIYEKMKGGKF
jgi:hypothetical protein